MSKPPQPNAASDTTQVEGLRAAAGSSYEALVRHHGGWMLAVARRIVGPEAARDCVQDAFLKTFQKINTFEERSSLRTWLHRIVVNAALQHLRRQRRRPELPLDELMPVFDRYNCRIEPRYPHGASIESLLTRKELVTRIRSAIDRLPDVYRTVIVLRDVEDLDTEEAADALGISTGAVKTRLHRARAALKSLLDPILEEVDS